MREKCQDSVTFVQHDPLQGEVKTVERRLDLVIRTRESLVKRETKKVHFVRQGCAAERPPEMNPFGKLGHRNLGSLGGGRAEIAADEPRCRRRGGSDFRHCAPDSLLQAFVSILLPGPFFCISMSCLDIRSAFSPLSRCLRYSRHAAPHPRERDTSEWRFCSAD